MAEIKVITELCAEDRKRIDDVFYALVQLVELAKGRHEMAAEVGKLIELPVHEPTEEVTPEEPEAPAGEVAPEEPEAPEAPAEEEAPKVTKEDIQQKVVALSAAGKKEEVKTIIKKYADRVSAIAEESYGKVWKELTALEG